MSIPPDGGKDTGPGTKDGQPHGPITAASPSAGAPLAFTETAKPPADAPSPPKPPALHQPPPPPAANSPVSPPAEPDAAQPAVSPTLEVGSTASAQGQPAKPFAAANPSAKPTSPSAPAPQPQADQGPSARTGLLWAAVVVLALVVGWQTVDRLNAPVADPALAALASRVATLEGRSPQAPPPDPRLEDVARRVAALEERPMQDPRLEALAARLAALEQRPAEDPRVGGLANRLAALEARPTTDPRLDEVANRLAALEQRPMQDPRLEAVAARLAAAMAAQAALETGRPLGPALATLPPGTPVPRSLSAFSDRPPPTIASLRRSFPDAAKAAREVREPVGEDFWERAGNRITGLVTVRRSGSVVIGDPVATVLAEAEKALEASDLRGALAALSALPPGAAQAMGGWVAETQSVLAARDDLVALAAGR